jgi:hypothetical protein
VEHLAISGFIKCKFGKQDENVLVFVNNNTFYVFEVLRFGVKNND